MKTGNRQNKELDRIGRRLLEAARPADAKIERIVNSPALFDAVKARIEAEKTACVDDFAGGGPAFFWNVRKSAPVFAALLIAVFAALGLFGFHNWAENAAERVFVTDVPPPDGAFAAPAPQDFESGGVLGAEKTTFPVQNGTKTSASNARLSKKIDTEKSVLKSKRPKIRKQKENLPAIEFYALGFPAANAPETGKELHVVRAELSRAELFALGVNLPIENGAEKIKADMLVGRDGVARAIRFVE